ncbi:PH domain-containing protein [Actinokineospora inagensis]|uniref:PH domain-containing protein n=1 Tax=Actinokineospora inagensis TaxID=103730 RepID=UPI00146FA61C|nr:PH domain-containing protein [Actinokineospora inagensis]
MRVIRHRAQHVFGSVLVVLVLATVGWSYTEQVPNETTWSRAQFTGLMIVIAWGMWLVVKTRVVVGEDGITVVNWFTRYSIPWGRLRSVAIEPQVTFLLDNGGRVRPAIGDPVLYERVLGGPVGSILGARSGRGGAGEVVRRLDLELVKLGLVVGIFGVADVVLAVVRG